MLTRVGLDPFLGVFFCFIDVHLVHCPLGLPVLHCFLLPLEEAIL